MGWFLFGSADPVVPVPGGETVPAEALSTGTLRTPITGEPTILVAGTAKTCQTCHALWESQPRRPEDMSQHRHIGLDHGTNDACLNCHDNDDRGRLALRDGETVAFADSPQLCAQCHGTTHRDWEAGIHGRTNGYWDAERGASERQVCVACHDPHHPAFPQLEPLPGPNTLRLVRPDGHHEVQLEGVVGRFREVVREARALEAAELAEERAAAAARSAAARARLEDDQ
jgi:hypothetical protein